MAEKRGGDSNPSIPLSPARIREESVKRSPQQADAPRSSLCQNKIRKVLKYPIVLQRLVNNAQKLPG